MSRLHRLHGRPSCEADAANALSQTPSAARIGFLASCGPEMDVDPTLRLREAPVDPPPGHLRAMRLTSGEVFLLLGHSHGAAAGLQPGASVACRDVFLRWTGAGDGHKAGSDARKQRPRRKIEMRLVLDAIYRYNFIHIFMSFLFFLIYVY